MCLSLMARKILKCLSQNKLLLNNNNSNMLEQVRILRNYKYRSKKLLTMKIFSKIKLLLRKVSKEMKKKVKILLYMRLKMRRN